ncbi:rhomboid family intramembrane serine protease [Aeoliella sp.]|uniref:rhomboid family intramembrane serine protease n=1 Tax=Aeoliella sp. TaxID=2795800 RepID=UPI003CCBC367
MIPLYDINPHRRFPLMTILLIVVNVWITWQTHLLPARRQAEVAFEHGFIPLRLTHVDDPQPVRIRQPIGPEKVLPNGQKAPQDILELDLPNNSLSVYSTMFTTMFMHAGWLHLIMNMWMLWIFGNNVEDRLGHFVFVMFYVAGGVVATLCHWAIDPESKIPVIGASGAVAAVLGAYALTFPWAKVKTIVFLGIPLLLDVPAFILLGLWMVLETLAAILQWNVASGVAHWAHIGGFVAGLLLMPLLAIGRPPPGEDWNKETDKLFQFEDPKPLTERQ